MVTRLVEGAAAAESLRPKGGEALNNFKLHRAERDLGTEAGWGPIMASCRHLETRKGGR